MPTSRSSVLGHYGTQFDACFGVLLFELTMPKMFSVVRLQGKMFCFTSVAVMRQFLEAIIM
jgi:hypothetical protein